jgi:uncharacterized protein
MELATRIYDAVVQRDKVGDEVWERLGSPDETAVRYWRGVLRVAALCHDLGHPPFSHAGEDLFSDGHDHETMTLAFMRTDSLTGLLNAMVPPITPEHAAMITVGPKTYGRALGIWETIVSEIITGKVFGADRMDYLLRDSLHVGVAYGRFDHHRLINTLRILPGLTDKEPTLGIEQGGMQFAESLLLARYFMFSQVYQHSVRVIYDIHLSDFLREWLPNRQLPTDPDTLMKLADSEVLSSLRLAATDPEMPAHDAAQRIGSRDHFRRVYERTPADKSAPVDSARIVATALEAAFGGENVRCASPVKEKAPEETDRPPIDFPVRLYNGEIVSAQAMSEVLRRIPATTTDFVYVRRGLAHQASDWLDGNLQLLLEANGG